mmetsp:Transcript_23436/g.67123  ORF Transcript_23436/g.67123 Transcript_23436/m.67123 type:complete len:380 (-) Transcript_23436:683-1822(-)
MRRRVAPSPLFNTARRVLEGCSSRLARAARDRLAAGIAAHATAVGRLLLPAALLASLAALLAALLALLRLVALLARRYARTLLGVLPLPALVPRRPLRRPLLHALARRRTVRRRGGRRRRRRREPIRGLAVLGFRLPRRRLAVLRWAARVLRASSAEVVGRQPPPSARGRLLPLRRRGACVFVRRERRVARDELRLEERLLAPRRVEVALRHLEPPLPRLALLSPRRPLELGVARRGGRRELGLDELASLLLQHRPDRDVDGEGLAVARPLAPEPVGLQPVGLLAGGAAPADGGEAGGEDAGGEPRVVGLWCDALRLEAAELRLQPRDLRFGGGEGRRHSALGVLGGEVEAARLCGRLLRRSLGGAPRELGGGVEAVEL